MDAAFLKAVRRSADPLYSHWQTVLFFFTVFMLMKGANIFQMDSLRPVVCDTYKPGWVESCENVGFPVFPMQLWCAQIIFALLYLVYVMHVIYGEGTPPKITEGKASGDVRKSVMCSYFAQLFVKIILEVAFIVAQYFLYGFKKHSYAVCEVCSCPHRVNCALPQATEIFSFPTTCLSLVCPWLYMY
ncbi:hypothetical protein SRHO_G00065030 [Serrasalmus rhombeus]